MINDTMPIIVIGMVVVLVFLALMLRGSSSDSTPSESSDASRTPENATIYYGAAPISSATPFHNPQPVYRIARFEPWINLPYATLPPRPIYTPPVVVQPLVQSPQTYFVPVPPQPTFYSIPVIDALTDDFVTELAGLKVRVQVHPHVPIGVVMRPVAGGPAFVTLPAESTKVRIVEARASQGVTDGAFAERVFSVCIPQTVARRARVTLTVTGVD